MKKAVFLDRDGTINVDKGYLYKCEDLIFEKNAVDSLRKLKKRGYLLIVITNQSGIARNYYKIEDMNKFNEYMNKILKREEAAIDEFYFCPHHPEGFGIYKKECSCRKPNNELIEKAIKKYNIDRNKSFMIGDKISDVKAGIKSNLKSFLVMTGCGEKEIKNMKKEELEKINICSDLKDFYDIISRKKLSGFIENEYGKKLNISSVVMDSRLVEKNSLFFAINNGNNFINEALEKGAALVIADKTDIKNDRLVVVKNTVDEMQNLAKKYREILNIKVIGVTGSNGKTTTKDIIYSILSKKFKCLKTQGNYNNHIGLPFTILNLTDDDEVAILEMGMSNLGEIKRLCEISNPDYGVITNIGESHLENLKNRENVFKAKTEILEFIKKENIFVSGDDDYLFRLDVNKIGFEKDKNNILIENCELSTTSSKFSIGQDNFEINLKGKYNINNSAIAIEISKKMGIEIEKIKEGLKNIEVSKMRFQEIVRGEDKYINDAYNASPTSMKASLNLFDTIYEKNYKIAILGDMLELGENEIEYHLEILKYLENKSISLVYLYGTRMKKAYEIFMEDKEEEYRFWHYDSKEYIAESLNKILMKKVVLLKGSRGMKLEEILEKIN